MAQEGTFKAIKLHYDAFSPNHKQTKHGSHGACHRWDILSHFPVGAIRTAVYDQTAKNRYMSPWQPIMHSVVRQQRWQEEALLLAQPSLPMRKRCWSGRPTEPCVFEDRRALSSILRNKSRDHASVVTMWLCLLRGCCLVRTMSPIFVMTHPLYPAYCFDTFCFFFLRSGFNYNKYLGEPL